MEGGRGTGLITHSAINVALSEQEMAAEVRRIGERTRRRLREHLEKVKADVNEHKELVARDTDDLRTAKGHVETKKLYLKSLKHIHETLKKEASAVERQLFNEVKNSSAKRMELSTIENANDNLRRERHYLVQKVKSSYGIQGLEAEVAALQRECEVKQARVQAVEEEIRQISARAARARSDDLNKFIVKLAEIKVGTAATERQIHKARAEIEQLESVKCALQEKESGQSRSAAQARALPSRHPAKSPHHKPLAASSEGQTSFHFQSSAVPSTPKQGAANQPARQSKGLPTRNVAPSEVTAPQTAPQLSISSARSPEPSRLLTSSAQSPEPPQPSTSSARSPQPSTSSAQTPEPNRLSAQSTMLGISEYFNSLKTSLFVAQSPKQSAEKRPGPTISKPFSSVPPTKQPRIKGAATAVPIPSSVAPPRPILSHPSVHPDKSAAVPAPLMSRSSRPNCQTNFFAATRSATPQPPQEATSRAGSPVGQRFSAEAHQRLNAAAPAGPLAVASPRPVHQYTSSIRHDARPDAPPRSFLLNYRAENLPAKQSVASQPQGASESGLRVSKHSSSETPQGHGAPTVPTTLAATSSRPIHQYTTTIHRNASPGASPQSSLPSEYRAQTFAAPQSAAPQPQDPSCTDLPVGRSRPAEAPRTRTAATVPTTLGTTSSGLGHQYSASIRRDPSPGASPRPLLSKYQAETAAHQGKVSEPQGGRPRIGTPIAKRVCTDTSQGDNRPGPFSPTPCRIPSRQELSFRPPPKERPASAQVAQPPGGQHAPEQGWVPALPPATQRQPVQSPGASSEWTGTPLTPVSETDQGMKPAADDASLRGSPLHSEFSFAASAQSPGGGGGGEDAFNLFGEDDDVGASGQFQFSIAGAGNAPPRFNF